MRKTRSRIALASIAGITAAGIAVAGAAGAQAHDRGGRGPGMDGRPVLSEAVVQLADGTYATVRSISGTVTAVSASSITVKASNGATRTFAVDASTTVAKDGSAATIAGITVGDSVHVHGTVSGDTITATRVHAGDPGARAGRGGRGHDGREGRGGMRGVAPSASPSA